VISLLLDKFPTLLNKLQVKEMLITGFHQVIFPFNGFQGVAHFVAISLKTITKKPQSVPAEKRL